MRTNGGANFSVKKYRCFAVVLLTLCMHLLTVSCSSDEDDNPAGRADIVGSWYGTRQYNSAGGAVKYQHLTVTFENDGTGTLEYDSPSSYSAASFYYRVSGSIISCYGAHATTNGDLDTDFEISFRIEGNRLLPQGRYPDFILTKDGSIVTDGNGNEIIDDSEALIGVWLNTDGGTILDIAEDTYDEYVLTSSFSKEYRNVSSDRYSYDPATKKVIFGTSSFLIQTLTSSLLVLKSNYSDKTLSYNKGTKNDIPSRQSLLQFLIDGRSWYTQTSDIGVIFSFGDDGSVVYMQDSVKSVGWHGTVTLKATGTYRLDGNRLTCEYTKIDTSGITVTETLWPGWSSSSPCTKTYQLEVCGNDILVTFPNGKTYTMSTIFY